MIRRLVSSLFLIAVGAVLAYYALGHHIVKTQDDVLTVPKARKQLKNTYVDISDWERSDFEEHPEFTKALLEDGHEDLVPVSSSERIKNWLEKTAREALE